ncbi:hypothetical protein QR685DRAFT_502747 [Neurospora intermedia]|uniref:Swiss Army Knife RNA repair protein HAD domain-containing protein n=1 Tax=Neurospora intermedia TaxID=5142 RepID=A0ABR3D532_NEUIN
MLYCNKKFHSSIFALRLQSFISVLDSRQLLRMSQPLPPVAPKAMMASSAFSVLNGSAQSQALPNGIPKGPKASHHSHGKAGGAKANGGGGAAAAQSVNAVHTHTAMGRWSILPKEPPKPDAIKAIHVYDFDNTLFSTPLPNPKLWIGPTIGTLSNPDAFVNGGWWHDSRILAATGEGLAIEEPRAWDGWWNEKIVELVELTMKQKDALCVLLTGRAEAGFSNLVRRMVESKGLVFDIIALKPAIGPDNQRFSSTMNFKQAFLEALMETYKHAEEIRIYEDRAKHTQAFRNFLADYNRKQTATPTRGPITGEVVQVADISTFLDPVVEIAEVQQLINEHNSALGRPRRGHRNDRLMIKKKVFYTGYMIGSADTKRLLSLAQLPTNLSDTELKIHGNYILICAGPCSQDILDKVGGLRAKMTWEVTGTACLDNKVWAVSVKPVPPTADFHTDNPSPHVVLAIRDRARLQDANRIQNWQKLPADKVFRFETTVDEKILLRIEPEDSHGSSYESRGKKRHHTSHEDDFRARPSAPGAFSGQSGTYGQGGRNAHHQGGFRGGGNQGGSGGRFNRGGGGQGQRNFRGGRGGGPGAKGRGGRGGGNSGGGGGHHYKSLDDLGTKDNSGVSYEDEANSSHQQPPGRNNTFQPPTAPAAMQQQQGGGGFYNNSNNTSNNNSQYQPPYQQQQQYGGGGGGGWQQQQQPGYQNQSHQGGRPTGGGSGGMGYGSGGPDINSYY